VRSELVYFKKKLTLVNSPIHAQGTGHKIFKIFVYISDENYRFMIYYLCHMNIKSQSIHTSRKSSLHNKPGTLSVTNCRSKILTLIWLPCSTDIL